MEKKQSASNNQVLSAKVEVSSLANSIDIMQSKMPSHSSHSEAAQVAAERERQFIGDILADENSDYDQEDHSPQITRTNEETKEISSKGQKHEYTFGDLMTQSNEEKNSSAQTSTEMSEIISKQSNNQAPVDSSKNEELKQSLPMLTLESSSQLPFNSNNVLQHTNIVDSQAPQLSPFLPQRQLSSDQIGKMLPDPEPVIISPRVEESSIPPPTNLINYDYANVGSLVQDSQPILPFKRPSFGKKFQDYTSKNEMPGQSRILNQNQLLEETSSNDSDSQPVEKQHGSPIMNSESKMPATEEKEIAAKVSPSPRQQNFIAEEVKNKIFESLSHNKKLQELVNQDHQDSFKDILSDMINETLNETLHDSNSLDEKNPQSKNHSEGAANSSQLQITDFANKVQDIQKSSSSNLLADVQPDDKSNVINSQTEEPAKPPSIGCESPSENNIYGTKDYFDYYTRLPPQHRDPKLPKPTYYESLGMIDDAANPDQLNTQNLSNQQEYSQFTQVTPDIQIGSYRESNNSNQQIGNGQSQEPFQSNFGHLGLINQMQNQQNPQQNMNAQSSGILSPTHQLVNQLMNQMKQHQPFKNQSTNNDVGPFGLKQSNKQQAFDQRDEQQHRQDQTIPQNQQDDHYQNQQQQQHNVSFGSLSSFNIAPNPNTSFEQQQPQKSPEPPIQPFNTAETASNQLQTPSQDQQSSLLQPQQPAQQPSQLQQQHLQQQFMILQMQHSQLNTQMFQTQQDLQQDQAQNSNNKAQHWQKLQQLGQQLQLVQLQMQQMMILMQQQQSSQTQQSQNDASSTPQGGLQQQQQSPQQQAQVPQAPLASQSFSFSNQNEEKKRKDNDRNQENSPEFEKLVIVDEDFLNTEESQQNVATKDKATTDLNTNEVPVFEDKKEEQVNSTNLFMKQAQLQNDEEQKNDIQTIQLDQIDKPQTTSKIADVTPQPQNEQQIDSKSSQLASNEKAKSSDGLLLPQQITPKGKKQQQIIKGQGQNSQIKRSEFLEKLIASMQNQETVNYRSLRGHVFECAVDQFGSRFIQQTLNETKDEESQMTDPYLQQELSEENLKTQPFKDLVFQECLQHSHTLINDVFGNYVIQKLIEHGSTTQKATIVDQILGDMVKLTRSKYGCRVIQKAIEHSEDLQRNLLVSELRNQNVLDLIKDQNANHVIQKCLSNLSSDQAQFITKRVIQKIDVLCIHTYGCRVIQKVLHIATYKEQKQIIKYILNPAQFDDLIIDQFGNYLIQSILEMSQNNNIQNPQEEVQSKSAEKIDKLYSESRLQIYEQIKGAVCKYSCHKFASNVIEKCMVSGTPQQLIVMVQEMLNEDDICKQSTDNLEQQQASNDLTSYTLYVMISDKFGNYVIQKCIDVMQALIKNSKVEQPDSNLYDILLMKIQKLENMHDSKSAQDEQSQNQGSNNYAKHVFEYVNKKLQIQPKNVSSSIPDNVENKQEEIKHEDKSPRTYQDQNDDYSRGYKFNKNKFKNLKGSNNLRQYNDPNLSYNGPSNHRRNELAQRKISGSHNPQYLHQYSQFQEEPQTYNEIRPSQMPPPSHNQSYQPPSTQQQQYYDGQRTYQQSKNQAYHQNNYDNHHQSYHHYHHYYHHQQQQNMQQMSTAQHQGRHQQALQPGLPPQGLGAQAQMQQQQQPQPPQYITQEQQQHQEYPPQMHAQSNQNHNSHQQQNANNQTVNGTSNELYPSQQELASRTDQQQYMFLSPSQTMQANQNNNNHYTNYKQRSNFKGQFNHSQAQQPNLRPYKQPAYNGHGRGHQNNSRKGYRGRGMPRDPGQE